MMQATVEVARHIGYVKDAWQTTTDPAHLTAELVFTLLFDGLVGAILWPLIKRAVRRHDERSHPAVGAVAEG